MNAQTAMKPQAPIIIIGLGFVLGSAFLWVKILTDYMTPFQMVAIRISLASLTVAALLLIRRELPRPGRGVLGGALVLALCDSVIPYSLLAWAAKSIDAGVGSVLVSTMPLFTAVFAVVLAKEGNLSVTKIGGLIVGFLGAAVIAAPDALDVTRGFQPTHLAVVGAAMGFGGSTVYARSLVERSSVLELSWLKLTFAAAIMVPLALATDGPPGSATFDVLPIVALLILGVLLTGAARLVYLWATSVIGSVRVSVVTYVIPVAGLILGWAVLGEQPAPATIAGFALIVASIAYVAPSQKKPATLVEEAAPAKTALDSAQPATVIAR